MTNLMSLPQFPAGTTIVISSNANFTDEFFIGTPNFVSSPLTIIGDIVAGQFVINNIASTGGLVPGMAVTSFGLRDGTIIAPGGIGATALTLNNSALVTVAGLRITVLPPPLDLTDITFSSMLRTSATTTSVLKLMTTANGLMVNGGQSGTFGWNVPIAKLPGLFGTSSAPQLSLVMGIHASDDTGAVVDLCAENGPIPVTVNRSVAT